MQRRAAADLPGSASQTAARAGRESARAAVPSPAPGSAGSALRRRRRFPPGPWASRDALPAGSQQFIDQDAPVLRIILELDDVVVAVVAAHQVRLRAAPHAAYLLQSPQHAKVMLMLRGASGKPDVGAGNFLPESRSAAFNLGRKTRFDDSSPGGPLPQKEKAGTMVPASPSSRFLGREENLTLLFLLRRFFGFLLGGFLLGF